ncbi:MAG: hypothetical protein D6795_13480, partial [Deltaproteobacteria bacterium]
MQSLPPLRKAFALILCALPLLWGSRVPLRSGREGNAKTPTRHLSLPTRSLPLRFEENRGQSVGGVKFLARGRGYALFLTPTAAYVRLHAPPGREGTRSVSGLRIRFVGADPSAEIVGEREERERVSLFLGNDPKGWLSGIPTFAQVRVRRIYPGIDLLYHGREGELEFDFIVSPGADPEQITLSYETFGTAPHVAPFQFDEEGGLRFPLARGEIRQAKPSIHREGAGKRESLTGGYLPHGGGGVGFALPPYDENETLVIDPVLTYSTYFGGDGDDTGYGIAVDAQGNFFVTGVTASLDFPTVDAIETTLSGGSDVFVTKFDATGTTLLFSTYLGGGGTDWAYGIALDSGGNPCVTGWSTSDDFPTIRAVQETFAGGSDAFVTKLDATGTQLLFSTYLGGGSSDFGQSVTFDEEGNPVVTGYTFSTDFPTVNAFQGAKGGSYDAFVTKFEATGESLHFSTYLGGTSWDEGRGVATAEGGEILVTGQTLSDDFPTLGAIQETNGGGRDVFL